MLITILTILFLSGGASTGWLYDFGDMKKQVKTVVADDERKDAALALVKELKARAKAERKSVKSMSKQLENAIAIADGDDSQLLYLGDQFLDNTRTYYVDVLDLRFELKQVITREEWTAAYAE